MKTPVGSIVAFIAALSTASVATRPAPAYAQDLVSRADVGRSGGQLVLALRAEPRTFNPVTAIDNPSRDVIQRTTADLIHVNRESHTTEPALATSWTISPDGRRFTLQLRHGVRFSDGDPFDADDVVFSFRVYLDEKLASSQRDLLTVGGKPIAVRKLDADTVQVDIAEPYASAERLFDSIAMLPSHVLEKPYSEGRLVQTWGLNMTGAAFAGLGPFRFKEYVAGERVVLERNPFYWKVDRAGGRLPYLDRLVFIFVPSEDAQTLRFQSGDADVITRVSAPSFSLLQRDQRERPYELFDRGPGLDHSFLFFNLNNLAGKGLAATALKQTWFRQLAFRQAASLAIDRDAIVRLVYSGRAVPLAGHVPPGNRLWANRSLPPPVRSIARARQLLQAAGFAWKADGALVDAEGRPVEFSIVTNTGNTERMQMATVIQDDLQQLGMRVRVVTLEFRALLDRLLTTFEYDAAVLGLAGGGSDPNAEMNVWLSTGGQHFWTLGQPQPATPWEAEIDALMRRQLTERDTNLRKRLYDQVQDLVTLNLPIISLVSPNVLVGARKGLGNFRPATLDHYALWNVEEIFWQDTERRRPVK